MGRGEEYVKRALLTKSLYDKKMAVDKIKEEIIKRFK
jgi:hypothetical protein